MPERGFNTEFWTDPFVRKLTAEAQYLYIYLWTNQRCNQAGLYQITPDVIAFETKLPVEKIPDLLGLLEPKVKWYPEQDLIWVKNFIKHQAKSPKFLIAAASRLKDINNNGTVKELIDYNLQKYSISIPYIYSMDSVSIPDSDTHAHANASAKAKAGKKGVVKGEEKPARKKTPRDKNKSVRTLGELANVKLTPEEYEKLVERFGAQGATSWIDELSLAKASKGYKSKSDYATILAWERRKRLEKGGADGADKKHFGAGEPLAKERRIRDVRGKPLR